jgi:hypothetical protein
MVNLIGRETMMGGVISLALLVGFLAVAGAMLLAWDYTWAFSKVWRLSGGRRWYSYYFGFV